MSKFALLDIILKTEIFFNNVIEYRLLDIGYYYIYKINIKTQLIKCYSEIMFLPILICFDLGLAYIYRTIKAIYRRVDIFLK